MDESGSGCYGFIVFGSCLDVELDASEAVKALSTYYLEVELKPAPSIYYKKPDSKDTVVLAKPGQMLQQNLLLIAVQSITVALQRSDKAISHAHLGAAISSLKCLSWPFESMKTGSRYGPKPE